MNMVFCFLSRLWYNAKCAERDRQQREKYIEKGKRDMLVSTIISVIVYIVSVVGMWMTFRKAGRMGWLSIIPIVNTVVICMIGWQKIWPVVVEVIVSAFGAILLVLGLFMAFFNELATLFSSGAILAAFVFGAIMIVIAMIFYIIMTNRLSKSFGHGAGYTVGLILIPFIMYLILGFGESEYLYEKKRGFRTNDPTPE